MIKVHFQGELDAIRVTGTAENIREIEAHLGPIESIWSGCITVRGRSVAMGSWLVRFGDALVVFGPEAMKAFFGVEHAQ